MWTIKFFEHRTSKWLGTIRWDGEKLLYEPESAESLVSADLTPDQIVDKYARTNGYTSSIQVPNGDGMGPGVYAKDAIAGYEDQLVPEPPEPEASSPEASS